jgi:4-aminobutyrate--pyruvate transaminase
MKPLSNMAVRDIETVIHPYTNLARHREVGPLILAEGKGIYVYDDKGRRYIEGLAGLWCTALGYGNEELEPDHSRPDDHEMLRHLAELERAGR